MEDELLPCSTCIIKLDVCKDFSVGFSPIANSIEAGLTHLCHLIKNFRSISGHLRAYLWSRVIFFSLDNKLNFSGVKMSNQPLTSYGLKTLLSGYRTVELPKSRELQKGYYAGESC